ncbi:hypothetical protein [Micromonospora globbae]|uniref:hypothetical protein n=1 Tax=Micromonospora globbae TaxID=1894969 RepID=UPI0013158385|nr:hypothetical protein [Micromonospora globbae]
MAVSHLRNTPITGKSYTTPVDATRGEGAPLGAQHTGESQGIDQTRRRESGNAAFKQPPVNADVVTNQEVAVDPAPEALRDITSPSRSCAPVPSRSIAARLTLAHGAELPFMPLLLRRSALRSLGPPRRPISADAGGTKESVGQRRKLGHASLVAEIGHF